MLTRNQGVYNEGKYSGNGVGKSPSLARNSKGYKKPKTYKRPRTRNKRKQDLTELIKSLNFNVFDSLKIKRSNGLIVNFKIEVSLAVMNYLVNRFQLKHRYEQNENFLSKLKLIKERQIDARCKSVVDSTFFDVKVMKKTDGIQGNVKIPGVCYLFIRFSKLIQVESHFV
jgi:hypothetical protein